MNHGSKTYRILEHLAMIPKGWTTRDLAQHFKVNFYAMESAIGILRRSGWVVSKREVSGARGHKRSNHYCTLEGVKALNDCFRRGRRRLQDLTAADQERAARLWRKGKRSIDIAVALRLSKSRDNQIGIMKVLLDQGLPIRRPWTSKEREALRALFPTTKASEVAMQLNRTLSGVYGEAHKLGVKPLTVRGGFEKGRRAHPAGEFKKGQGTWNKGMKGLRIPGSERTWFKKGHAPANTKHDGAISIRKDFDEKTGIVRSYQWIRIATKRWEMLHVHVWKKAGRTIPPGHIVVFANGDTMDTRIENLRLITNAQHMKESRLKDRSIAAILARIGQKGRGPIDRQAYEEILRHPELIEAKRQQLKLQESLREHGS